MPGKRGLISVLSLSAAALCAPSGAAAQSAADATCPPLGGGNYVTSGENRYAQTFTAGTSGKLTSAEIRITKNVPDGPGDYVFRLAPTAAGVPTNDVIGSTTVPEANVPGGSINLPTTATFSQPPPVTAGVEYALVVTRPGAGGNGLRLNGRAGGCAGSLFRSDGQAGNFMDIGADLVFTAFVDRIPTVTLGKRPKKRTRSETARFKFSADENGATFQCKLDGRKFKKCKSPLVFRDLDPRKHKLRIRATDAVGNVSPTVVHRWKVLG